MSGTRRRDQAGSAVVQQVLDRVAAVTRAGHGVVVLLSGPPGSGKSTTLEQLTALLPQSGPRVAARVTADETSRRYPFGVIADLVGLVAEYPPQPDRADRILSSVDLLCQDGPVALCIDDVHQADGDSLQMVEQLADAAHDLPLTLLLTRRLIPARESLARLAVRPDVLSTNITGLTPAGVAQMVVRRCGAPPGPRLSSALTVAAGNPFHINALLTELERGGQLQSGQGVVDLTPALDRELSAWPSVLGSVRSQLAVIPGGARDVLQILAVWGRPADLTELGAIAGLTSAEVRRTVGPAVEAQIVRWEQDEHLTFTHDLYRDVLYGELVPGVRRLLHAACAARLRTSGGISTVIAQHAADSAPGGMSAALALQTAATDLKFAPEQAADLLGEVRATPGSAEADAVAVARAGALAAAGRMGLTEQVARDALAVTQDERTHDTLTRLLLHSMVGLAQTAGSLVVIDAELARDCDPDYRHALTHLRRWVVVMAGRETLSGIRPAEATPSGAALVPTAMELFLQARSESALSTVLEAQSAREANRSPAWSDGVTAPVWPPWFALYARGPETATAYSLEARRTAQQTGRGWLFPSHLTVAGMIDFFAGRWDDALTEFEAGAEAAAATGTGWLSRGTGGLLQIQVQRGQLAAAAAGVTRWRAQGLPNEYGMPWPELAEILLGEASGDPDGSLELARASWAAALDTGRQLWALIAGPDVARLALQSGDDSLLQRVSADVTAVAVDQVPALAATVDMVLAMTNGDAAMAAQAATAHTAAGHVVGAMYAWEEAAVAAAAAGDKDFARSCAAQTLQHAATLGAVTVERRLAARLRRHRIRLGATGPRARPLNGLASLTPTELRVAEKVADGLTSPQIAAQLYLSPRTVQSHISHILRKMDLRSRVELATTFDRLTRMTST